MTATSTDFSSTSPAAPTGNQNLVFQDDTTGNPVKISGYIPPATTTLLGVVKPDGVTTFVDANGVLRAVGSAGPAGPTGPTGATGATGPTGQTGATGPAGATGQGFNYRGAWTASTAYAPYDVVTYSGQTYEASTSFTSGASFNSANWNLWAAQGATGATGPQGPTGATGSVPTAISNGPAWPPAIPGSLDDEFTGTSLSNAWTWVNQGGATATISQSHLVLKAPSSNSGPNWQYIYQNAPATPWEVTIDLDIWASYASNYWNAGLILSDSSGKIILYGPNLNLNLGVSYFNSPTAFNSGQANGSINSNGKFILKIQDDGTNLIFSFSKGGVAWMQWSSLSRTAFLTSGPTRIGIGVDSENNSPVILDTDWFRRTL